ncbi:MAG: pseudouridine synthase [Chitinophagaceae bacterium]|nr:pseudouridine synthase [Chitinophagaceae bacterium]
MNSEDFIAINKYVSSSGYCSRREADKLIEQKRVMIGERVAKITDKVKPNDKVFVDFELIKRKANKEATYILLNKPKGITSTTDLKDKTNIVSFLNFPKRLFPVGRLDKDSTGIIILTDDGDIVNKILRLGNKHDKEYIVQVSKPIDDIFLEKMANGVFILGTKTAPCKIKKLSNKKFSITLKQGLNRQIRRMCEVLDNKVLELERTRIMHIQKGNLLPGKYRHLTLEEKNTMLGMLQHSSGEV